MMNTTWNTGTGFLCARSALHIPCGCWVYVVTLSAHMRRLFQLLVACNVHVHAMIVHNSGKHDWSTVVLEKMREQVHADLVGAYSTHEHPYTHTHTHTHPSIHPSIHTSIHTYIHTCMHAWLSLRYCSMVCLDDRAQVSEFTLLVVDAALFCREGAGVCVLCSEW